MNFDNFNEKNPKLTETLRWILVLPAAIIGALIAFAFMRFIHWLGGKSNFDFFYNHIISAVVFGGAFVYSAAYVAPKYKVKVAIIFAILLSLASIFTIFLCLINKSYFDAIKDISAIVGAIATAIYISYNKSFN